MGQKSWVDSYDPRFSLAMLDLNDNGEKSSVKKCAFNKNYNGAIGLFYSNKIVVSENVVYHTIGAGTYFTTLWSCNKKTS